MTGSVIPAPLVIEPSGHWVGIDGNWSSFIVNVGTPGQAFNTLPATGSNAVWLPLPEGCSDGTQGIADCGASRGVIAASGPESDGFNINASATWSQVGLYGLTIEQGLFDQQQNGLYGLDTVALGESEANSLDDQLVAGISSADIWLGSLGLGAQSIQFSGQQDMPSLLSAMKNSSLIPSLSYGYTAGASYRNSQGSLVLGGFDEAAFDANDAAFLVDPGTGLTVHMSSLVVSNTLVGTMSVPLNGTTVAMSVDSAFSELWLPPAVCNSLAHALNLTLDPSTGRYLIDQDTRRNLVAASPEFTFTLAANDSSAQAVDIVLPWSAFDQLLLPPIYQSAVPYFPLRQTPKGSTSVLGRTFLQEAYVVVDWERGNFTLAQARSESATPSVVAIMPASDGYPQSQSLGTGPIAGIVVGAVLLLGILAAAILYLRRIRRAREARMAQNAIWASSEAEKTGSELQGREAGGANELHGDAVGTSELRGKPVGTLELHGDVLLRELHGDPVKQQLMSRPVYELDGAS